MPRQPPTLVNTAVTYTATTRNGVNTRYRWYFDDGSETAWSLTVDHAHLHQPDDLLGHGHGDATIAATEQTQTFSQTIHLPMTADRPANSEHASAARRTAGSGSSTRTTIRSAFSTRSTNAKLAEIAVGTAPRTVASPPVAHAG